MLQFDFHAQLLCFNPVWTLLLAWLIAGWCFGGVPVLFQGGLCLSGVQWVLVVFFDTSESIEFPHCKTWLDEPSHC